jgi:hypothetical protein
MSLSYSQEENYKPYVRRFHDFLVFSTPVRARLIALLFHQVSWHQVFLFPVPKSIAKRVTAKEVSSCCGTLPKPRHEGSLLPGFSPGTFSVFSLHPMLG